MTIFWGGDVPGYERVKLFTDYLVPVCSREMYETIKGRTILEVISSVNFIHEFSHEWWVAWCRSENIDVSLVQKGMIVDDPGALESAAVSGHGLVLGSVTFLKRRIESGEIVVPFGIRSPIEIPYCLLTKPAELKRRSVREFRAWILETLSKEAADVAPIADACHA